MSDFKLDRSRPVHRQVAADIRRRIEAGEWDGQRLPGLVAFSNEYGVAVSTIQKSLANLRAEGLIRVELGLGTWPIPPEEREQA